MIQLTANLWNGIIASRYHLPDLALAGKHHGCVSMAVKIKCNMNDSPQKTFHSSLQEPPPLCPSPPQNHLNPPHLWVIYQCLKHANAALYSWSVFSIQVSALSHPPTPPPLPTFPHPQYDYMERLDGKEKWSVVESPRERRSIQTVVLNEAVFVQYLDAGSWHLAFYNDGREMETVSFSTNIMGETGWISTWLTMQHG